MKSRSRQKTGSAWAQLGLLLWALGCAPEQPAEQIGCDSLSDCALGEICDKAVNSCIPEPENRALGAFSCTVTDSTEATGLELSDVILRIADDRWSLPSVGCIQRPGAPTLLLTMQSLTSGGGMVVLLDAADLADGRVALGPHVDVGVNAAMMQDFESFDLFGTSNSGSVEMTPTPQVGRRISGHLDVSFFPVVSLEPPADDDALFGIPCPRGLADCGDKTGEVGGADACFNVTESGPVCTRFCEANSDCALGEGVCVSGFCTRACNTHADCTPLQCYAGDPGQSAGCL